MQMYSIIKKALFGKISEVGLLRIILLGAPGVGKGTQAKLICDTFRIPHISTGDIFRSNIREKTLLGIQAKEYIEKGDLVPDELTISIVKDRLMKQDCREGFLLDGFPRNLHQARELEFILAGSKQCLDKVLLIDIPRHLILERVVGRRFCTQCGASYHITFNPSKAEGICDACGGTLMQRHDDTKEIVSERLSVYHRTVKPLVDYYSALGILYKVQGNNAIDEVFSSIYNSLQVI